MGRPRNVRALDPPPDLLRDVREAVPWAKRYGYGITQSWRWHREAYPDDAVSLSTWRRRWREV